MYRQQMNFTEEYFKILNDGIFPTCSKNGCDTINSFLDLSKKEMIKNDQLRSTLEGRLRYDMQYNQSNEALLYFLTSEEITESMSKYDILLVRIKSYLNKCIYKLFKFLERK